MEEKEKKDENKKEKKEKKKNNNRQLKLVIAILISVVLVMEDVYVMINMPQNFLIMATVTVLLLVAVYFAIESVTSEIKENQAQKAEQYENLSKTEKATYVLLRKAFEDLYELIEDGNRTEKLNTEEIIHAQKAVAKVTIGRSKENSDALMNSNDKIIEKMAALEAVLSENGQQQAAQAQDKQYVQDIINTQNKILDELNRLQQSIKQNADNISNLDNKLEYKLERIQDKMADISAHAFVERRTVEEKPAAVPVVEPEPVVKEEPAAEPEPVIKEEPAAEPEPVMEEAPAAEPEPVMEEAPAAEPEPVIEDEPIADTELQLDEPMEDTDIELGFGDEPIVDTMPEIDAAPDNTPEDSIPVEKIPPEDEVIEEEKPPMPDLSDPNKVMTPEEIAALIANL